MIPKGFCLNKYFYLIYLVYFIILFIIWNLSKLKFIPRRVVVDFNNLIRVTSKVQKRAASIGFVKKALYQEVTPKFALVKGQFKTEREEISGNVNKR